MNPARLFRIYRAANRIGNLLEEAAVSKALWKSKTFWFNLLSAGASLVGVVPLDPQLTAIIVAGINVGLRVVTKGPVTVLTDAGNE